MFIQRFVCAQGTLETNQPKTRKIDDWNLLHSDSHLTPNTSQKPEL